MYVCVCVCVSTRMYTYLHAYVHTYQKIHIYTSIHTCIRANVHTYEHKKNMHTCTKHTHTSTDRAVLLNVANTRTHKLSLTFTHL